MIHFFLSDKGSYLALETDKKLSKENIKALQWLFSNAKLIESDEIKGLFIGPRKEMITPWSTSAVEITLNMNIKGIKRIEEFFKVDDSSELDSITSSNGSTLTTDEPPHDRMLQRVYRGLNQTIFTIDRVVEKIKYIEDIHSYNTEEGLALSDDEIEYLNSLSVKLGRALTDSEVFGFSQINSEHCRHKIFNGTFIIDGKEMESSLFELIKKTSKVNPGRIVSAYKDNCAFIEGPKIKMFHPSQIIEDNNSKGEGVLAAPSLFTIKEEETVISLKAETHNFPTTVEPFNGAATGSGGEIRDRIAGGKGSFPIAGTAVYMTSPIKMANPREWLYHSPLEILIKASDGASDFGNKFGQPLICGSLFTMSHTEQDPDDTERKYGYDKVIMLAGGVGYAKKRDSIKESPEAGDEIVLLGGDNYRIGMGGGAVSSVATGEYANAIELNAVQRSNPEMQKRAYNAIRAIAESDHNTIISVHDHGAGGHLNCLSELVEETGGDIDLEKLPVGDPTLSAKEIIGNESQERMGLVMKSSDTERLRQISERERAPFYIIGKATGKGNFTFKDNKTGETPINLQLKDMFGSTPKTIMTDSSPNGGHNGMGGFSPLKVDICDMSPNEIESYISRVLKQESVACKDWLTNKVDRSVTGLIACQQTCGEIQLPLNNLGVTAIGYDNKEGIATSLGHAPLVGLIDPAAGSRMSIAEALTNLVWAPIKEGLSGVSLSANWMWPCRNEGENSRLYSAVKGASDFAIALGINIPTGKDSMSMTQKYPNGDKILSPGTLIVSAVGECTDINKVIHPVLVKESSTIFYIPFVKNTKYPLGGSAFAQVTEKIGSDAPDITDPLYFRTCFNAIQQIISTSNLLLSGHDVSSGGLITTLLELCFPRTSGGLEIDLRSLKTPDIIFSEVPAIVVQIKAGLENKFLELLPKEVNVYNIGEYIPQRKLNLSFALCHNLPAFKKLSLDIDEFRDTWFHTSYIFDKEQVGRKKAIERFQNYSQQPLRLDPSPWINPTLLPKKQSSVIAAIIREKGSNGDREMAWALNMAGFKVKDVHVTDLTSGRESLDDVQMIVFVGGFSNADTLGSAKGWAGALHYNEKAKETIDRFYSRKDTLSLGVCNGCQLMAELGLITPESRNDSPKMHHNDSRKYESAFIGVQIERSPSILLSSLQGSRLGIWVAHGEGKFHFPKPLKEYNIALRYTYKEYPGNPNGSPEGVAGVCSPDGRHLAMMPHPERCLRPWNLPYCHLSDEERENRLQEPPIATRWLELFINGRKWLESLNNKK